MDCEEKQESISIKKIVMHMTTHDEMLQEFTKIHIYNKMDSQKTTNTAASSTEELCICTNKTEVKNKMKSAETQTTPVHMNMEDGEIQTLPDIIFEELLNQLECPVCYEYMAPPIIQCSNGHNICSRPACKREIRSCPICRGDLCNVRNRGAELLAQKITHPCNYRQYGCMDQCLLEFQTLHEDKCRYKPHRCPLKIIGSCNWSGPIIHMRAHIERNHPNNATHYTNDEINVSLCDVLPLTEKGWIRFIFTMGEVFFFYGKISHYTIDMCIMQVSPKSEEMSYKYSVTLKNLYHSKELTSTHFCQNYNTFINQLHPDIPVKGISSSFMHGFVLECMNCDNQLSVHISIARC